MTPEDICEEWRERAAIMEHDGGLSAVEADRAAWERIKAEHGSRLAARGRVEAMRRGWA